jgi:hypothetical protein
MVAKGGGAIEYVSQPMRRKETYRAKRRISEGVTVPKIRPGPRWRSEF